MPRRFQVVNMEESDFDDWTLCQHINERFYEKLLVPLQCILCSSVTQPDGERYLSTFWTLTSCWGGHTQIPSEQHDTTCAGIKPGVCDVCDLYFVLNVAKGQLLCRQEGCRRAIRVDYDIFIKTTVERDNVKQRYVYIQKQPQPSPVLMMTLISEMPRDLVSAKFLLMLRRRATYECCVLMCDGQYGKLTGDAYKNGPTPECDHDRNACDDCLKAAFESAINSSDLAALACPESGCLKPVRGESIRKAVSHSSYRKY